MYLYKQKTVQNIKKYTYINEKTVQNKKDIYTLYRSMYIYFDLGLFFFLRLQVYFFLDFGLFFHLY